MRESCSECCVERGTSYALRDSRDVLLVAPCAVSLAKCEDRDIVTRAYKVERVCANKRLTRERELTNHKKYRERWSR